MKSTIYQGWRYDFDQTRAAGGRYVAKRAGKILTAPSERAMRDTIEDFVEMEAEHRAKEMA